MCSVVGCDSWRHNVQRFRLPEDPERRLEWVLFLFEVNKQRLKESSWTDITICSEHFTDDCFASLALSGSVQLKPGAVPSLWVNTEPEEPVESSQQEEPVAPTDAVSQCDDLDLCKSSTCSPEITKHTLRDALTPGSSDTDLNQELPALQNDKYTVNENCLLTVFGHKCPSCEGKLQVVKVTNGELIILKQRCLKCEYKNKRNSQVGALLPAADDGHLTGGTEGTPETQLTALTDDSADPAGLSEVVTFRDEKSDPSDDEEEGNRGGMSSDGDWNPTEELSLADQLTKESEETEDEGKEEGLESPSGLEINELCTECGRFFLILKPHTCEHKIKPYSCNICGKRCVSEILLSNHSKIHDETYEHPCKYCYVTFKTRADKFKHELTHQDKKDPFKCPDCPKTFATSKERQSHLAKHRVSREFKCGVCGIEFKDIHHLRRHSVVHTGLKPYKCSVCQRGFNQTSHLKSHMRLHTGERPYKCQLCDKCFNHNVSLKSHVQRYHTSGSGLQQMDKRANNAKGNKNKRNVNSEYDSVKEKQKVQKGRSVKTKNKRRSTGRPRGRPSRRASGDITGQLSKAKMPKSKVQKLKKTGSSDEESEDKQSGSDLSFDSTEEEEEEEEEEETMGGRPNGDSDSDFNPEVEAKKKRCSSQKTVKKRRERSTKGLVV